MEAIVEDRQSVVRLLDENTGAWKFVRKDKGPLKSIELVESLFQKLGLTKNEIRVYVFLARSRERKASEISEALSLHRTETYRILRDLEKRGLVSSVFEKPLKFIAKPFEGAVDALIEAKKLRIRLLEKRKKELVKIWLSLPQPKVKIERKEVFQILEGAEQIDIKANEIAQNLRKQISVFTSDEDLSRLYHSGFIDGLETLQKQDFDVRILASDSAKSRFFIEKAKLKNGKCAPSNVKDLPTFILADEEQLLLIIRRKSNHDEKGKRLKIAALWTNYEAFIKPLERLFSELWKAGDEELMKIVSPT